MLLAVGGDPICGFSTPEQWVDGGYLIDELAKRDY